MRVRIVPVSTSLLMLPPPVVGPVSVLPDSLLPESLPGEPRNMRAPPVDPAGWADGILASAVYTPRPRRLYPYPPPVSSRTRTMMSKIVSMVTSQALRSRMNASLHTHVCPRDGLFNPHRSESHLRRTRQSASIRAASPHQALAPVHKLISQLRLADALQARDVIIDVIQVQRQYVLA